jgi:hypothetical protein
VGAAPEILFLDEPTASLDPGATHEIETVIAAMHAAGTKIVMVTHNLGRRAASATRSCSCIRAGSSSARRRTFLRSPASPRPPISSKESCHGKTPSLFIALLLALVALARSAGALHHRRVDDVDRAVGLFGYLLPIFEKKTGIKVRVVALGTGRRSISRGAATPTSCSSTRRRPRRKFLAEGEGVKRFPVMYNDFVLIGPKSDPAKSPAARTSPSA